MKSEYTANVLLAEYVHAPHWHQLPPNKRPFASAMRIVQRLLLLTVCFLPTALGIYHLWF